MVASNPNWLTVELDMGMKHSVARGVNGLKINKEIRAGRASRKN